MKNIKTLIKLKKQELDTKRKNLVEWQAHLAKLEKVIDKLDLELKQEQEVVEKLGGISYTYNNYYLDNRAKKDLVTDEIKKHQELINNIEKEIFIDFSELQKYKIVLNNHIEQSLKLAQKKEQEGLDEMSINSFQHNNKN